MATSAWQQTSARDGGRTRAVQLPRAPALARPPSGARTPRSFFVWFDTAWKRVRVMQGLPNVAAPKRVRNWPRRRRLNAHNTRCGWPEGLAAKRPERDGCSAATGGLETRAARRRPPAVGRLCRGQGPLEAGMASNMRLVAAAPDVQQPSCFSSLEGRLLPVPVK